jgi:hypothetical protein
MSQRPPHTAAQRHECSEEGQVPGKSFRIKRLYTQVTQYFDFKKYEKETMNQEVNYTQGMTQVPVVGKWLKKFLLWEAGNLKHWATFQHFSKTSKEPHINQTFSILDIYYVKSF